VRIEDSEEIVEFSSRSYVNELFCLEEEEDDDEAEASTARACSILERTGLFDGSICVIAVTNDTAWKGQIEERR
jgi:hypothetical protein